MAGFESPAAVPASRARPFVTSLWLGILAGAFIALPTRVVAAGDVFSISMRVDLGLDVGQNFGSLFEARDAEGRVVAGAGYLGSYNTQARSDRRLVHFYVKPAEDIPFEPETLPRPTSDAGTYLFEFDGRLFSQPRGGAADRRLRVWNENGGRWQVDDRTEPFSIRVGDGVLAASPRAVTYAGRTVLQLEAGRGSMAEPYYANGSLCFRRYDRSASPPGNELVACRWTSDRPGAVLAGDGTTIAMGTAREFVYAWGQLGDQVVAATNTGGVYVLDDGAWRTVLEPDVNVSFQIYAMLNYRDKLLMGQYPTGELFEYDGKELRHIKDWPPAMPGVRKQAREAQTLAIYGGDIIAGVWPWGEVWKYDGSGWDFMGRMFTHPEPTAETTHPYETETKQQGAVLNRWGQRVTSLVSLDDALFISTSSKGGTPYEPKFSFLAGGKWKEYGKVYRYRKPGCLAARTEWTGGPTTLEFRFSGDRLSVWQDGKELASTRFEARLAAAIAPEKTRWGQGVFGPFRGRIEERAAD